MEKTITIDGKKVRFRNSGAVMLRYKMQFGKEFLAELAQMEEAVQTRKVKGKDTVVSYDLEKFNLEVMYNILWTLAKNADNSIPEPLEWLDSFEEFPVFDIFQQIEEILSNDLKIDRKNV